MPELFLLLLLGMPWLGGVIAAVAGRSASGFRVISGLSVGAMLQFGVAVWWLQSGTADFTVTCPASWGSSPTGSITLTWDQTRAVALMATAGVFWVLAWDTSGVPWTKWQRTGVWWLLGLSNLFWLSDDVLVSCMAQTALLGGGCLLLASSDEGTTIAPVARQTWITLTCGDALLWWMALWWFAEFQTTLWSAPGQPAHWQALSAVTPAVMTATGLILWCGTLARGWQFPLGALCDSAAEVPCRWLGLLWGVILAPIGWRWLAAGLPLFWLSPECHHLVQGAAWLSGCLAAWFSLCSVDPRVRVAWLLSWQWSFVVAAFLMHPDWGVSLSGWLGTSGLLTGAALLSLWTTETPFGHADDTRPPGVDDRSAEPVVASFVSSREGRSVSFHWITVTQQLKAHWPGTSSALSPADRSPRVMALGGRGTVLCASVLLALGPLLVSGMTPLDTFDATAAESPKLSWLPLLTLCAGIWALTRLVLSTVAAKDRATWAVWWHVTLTPLLPWLVLVLSPASLGQVLPGEATAQRLALGLAVGVGLALGLLGERSETARARQGFRETLARLGRRRLYLPQLWLLGLNLPLRAGAQMVRFLDWFVIDGVLLNGVGYLARWDFRHPDELQNRDQGFYALTLGLGAVSVAVTLMWLAQ